MVAAHHNPSDLVLLSTLYFVFNNNLIRVALKVGVDFDVVISRCDVNVIGLQPAAVFWPALVSDSDSGYASRQSLGTKLAPYYAVRPSKSNTEWAI